MSASATSCCAVMIAAGLLGPLVDSGHSGQNQSARYKDVSLPIDKRVDDLPSRMTIEEKIGQMTQADHSFLKSRPTSRRCSSARC